MALGWLTTERVMWVTPAPPPIPPAMSDTGIPQRNLLNLMLKFMHIEACETVPELAGRMKLPHRVVQQLLGDASQLRLLQALVSVGGGLALSIPDSLSDRGRTPAKRALEQNRYRAPSPGGLAAFH